MRAFLAAASLILCGPADAAAPADACADLRKKIAILREVASDCEEELKKEPDAVDCKVALDFPLEGVPEKMSIAEARAHADRLDKIAAQNRLQRCRKAGGKDPHLEKLVTRIDKQMKGALNASQELLDDPEWRKIHAEPKKHQADVLALLKRSDLTETQKLMLTYTMHKLPLADYVKYLEHLLGLRKGGHISDNVFTQGLLPGNFWSTKLQENYNDKRVVALLKKAKPLVEDKEWSSYVDHILSGKAAEEVRQAREDEVGDRAPQ